MAYLTWLSDDDLFVAVERVYNSLYLAWTSKSLQDLQRNVVDPFSLMFETYWLSEGSIEEWIRSEVQRQIQKTLSNAVGNFHQEVLGSCSGWVNLGIGYGVDLKRKDDTMFAEVKNKYNTLKGSNHVDMWNKLSDLARKHRNSIVYMVWIINKPSKSSFDEVWTVSGMRHERVRLISGDLFYDLASGTENALSELYRVLPLVMKEVVQKHDSLNPSDVKAIQEMEDLTDLEAAYHYFFDAAFPQA